MSFSYTRYSFYAVLFFILLTTVLFFFPEKKKHDQQIASPQIPTAFQFDSALEKAKEKIPTSDRREIIDLEDSVKSSSGNENDVALYRQFTQLALKWDMLHYPGIAAHYYEDKASLESKDSSIVTLTYVADRYLLAFRNSIDSLERKFCIEKAISIYEKIVIEAPGNLNAKANLGMCYAEGTSDPMKGITLLREVVSVDNKNEIAQLNLGLLSVKSGQYEKAIERFETVLRINSKNIDVYLYLANVYSQLGNSKNAIDNLKKYKSGLSDPETIAQVDEYIQQIESSGHSGVKN